MNTYFRILSYAKPYRSYLPQYIVYTLLGILFSLTQFTLLKPLFDVIFEQLSEEELQAFSVKPEFEISAQYAEQFFNYWLSQIKLEYGDQQGLIFVCAVIAGSVLFSNLFRYLSLVTVAKARARLVRNLRNDVFGRITDLHLGYFSNERKGDIMSRLTNDVKEIEFTVVDSIKVMFRDPLTILVFMIYLFSQSARLTLFSLIILPVGALIISVISKKLKRKAHLIQEIQSKIVGILDETLGGVRIIKAFTAKKHIDSKFDHQVTDYARTYVSLVKTHELASPLSQFLGVLLVTAILVYGGMLVLNNQSELDASAFFTYIIVFTQILQPGKEISKTVSNVQKGLASADRLFHILDVQPEIQDKLGAKEIKEFNTGIEFKNVSFAYETEMVLKDINLKVPKGKTVALVGASGGGKSSLVDLIPRFYEAKSGEVLVDGKPLGDYTLNSLRKLMGIVTQESILFNDTVLNNIAFGMENAKKEDVIHAAKIANAHEFIANLENGYDTFIGDRGSKLSGGQRQRLSIARAVMKNPPILILDEATSALDSESEKLVQEALTKLMDNRTSVVIAHRLSTVQHADEIIVMEKGRIVERGTHESLIEKGGQYKKLIVLQQGAEVL